MINQDILDTIKKNLPAIAGEMILSELEELKRLKDIESKWKSQYTDAQNLKHQLDLANTRLDSQVEINKKIADIELRERELRVKLLEKGLEEANKRADMVLSLVTTIFRNPVVTKKIDGYLPAGVQQPSQYNSCATPLTGSISTTEVHTET
jgi:hypothetical protein